MEVLCNLNIVFDEDDILEMTSKCPELSELDNNEIEESIQILKNIECTSSQIKNIVISNPNYLCKSKEDINELILKLLELGFSALNILFDSNPYILNKDSFEIEEHINERLKNNELLEDIVDDLETHPYLFDEM